MARVLITGSSDGLGRMAARLLIEQGHGVVLHATKSVDSKLCAPCRERRPLSLATSPALRKPEAWPTSKRIPHETARCTACTRRGEPVAECSFECLRAYDGAPANGFSLYPDLGPLSS